MGKSASLDRECGQKKTTKDKKEPLLKAKPFLEDNRARELQLNSIRWLIKGDNPLSMENCGNKNSCKKERGAFMK